MHVDVEASSVVGVAHLGPWVGGSRRWRRERGELMTSELALFSSGYGNQNSMIFVRNEAARCGRRPTHSLLVSMGRRV